MLQGAIIGLVVGLIFAVITLARRKGTATRLAKALETGGPKLALEEMNRRIPACTKIPAAKILDQLDRMAALTIIGDVEQLEAELEGHTGKLTAVTQVNALGWLGVALRSDDPAPAVARLEAIAERVETEGGATLKLVKRNTRMLASLSRGLLAEAVPADVRAAADSYARSAGQLHKAVVWQVMAECFARVGADAKAEELKAQVRQVTTAFDR